MLFAEICEHSAFGPRFSGELYARDGNVATLRTTDISADGRIEYGTMPLARLDLSKLQQHILRMDDLVVTRSGRVGTAAVFKGFRLPVLPGAFLIRFRLKCEVADPRFYRYFFNSPAGQELLISVATGSVQQNLNITSVHGLDIPVPPLPEQRTIVHILGMLDDKIELNRRMNETLETMARALFKSWFVDFDPVRAKAEGRDPGLPQPLAALFPDRFEDSELGEIPAGWKVGRFEDVLVLQRGFDLPATARTSGPYPVIAASGPNGMHNQFMVRGPGVTTGRSGVLGNVFYVHEDFWPLNTSLWVKEFKHLTPVYAFHLLRRLDFGAFNAGSAVPTLNRNHVHNLPILMPPMDLILAFDTTVVPMMNRQKASAQESLTLTALRDTLLPKLISGELRVKDAERFIGRAS
jgi:type I restriction enzyme S subunit